jgi:hypothetical protein
MLNTCVGTVTTHNLRGHSQFTGERGPSWHRSALTNLSRVLLGFPSHVRSRHRARDCAVPQADARQEPSEPGASPVLAPSASRGCGGFVRSPSSGHSRHASDHLPRARMTRRHLNAFFLPEATIKSDRREKASKITLFVLAVLVLLWPWRFPRRLSQEPCPLQAAHRSEVHGAGHAAQTMGLEEHRRERPVACPTTNSPSPTALGYGSQIPLGLRHGIYFCRASARYSISSPVRTYSTTA